MPSIKLGIQLHSLREDFAADYKKTLTEIRGMGYEGVEFTIGQINGAGITPEACAAAVKEAGLECFGLLCGWKDVQPENIAAAIDFNRRLGSPFLIIGSISPALVPDKEAVDRAIEVMKQAAEQIHAAGFETGYHNHDSDFTHVVDGKPLFMHIFDATPDDFIMLLDTGNAMAGGYEPTGLLEKYPHRTKFLHIKGYSQEKGYLAYIGEDDLDWPKIIHTARVVGGALTFSVEFGKRGDYDPKERAADSRRRVAEWLKAEG